MASVGGVCGIKGKGWGVWHQGEGIVALGGGWHQGDVASGGGGGGIKGNRVSKAACSYMELADGSGRKAAVFHGDDVVIHFTQVHPVLVPLDDGLRVAVGDAGQVGLAADPSPELVVHLVVKVRLV